MEPNLHKVGSKEAGQHWTEVAEHLNSRVGFRENPQDQGSVRERFNKHLNEFKAKTSSEGAASGIAVDPLTENADFKACTHGGALLPQHVPATRSRSKAPSSAPTISSEIICRAANLFAPVYEGASSRGKSVAGVCYRSKLPRVPIVIMVPRNYYPTVRNHR